MNHPNNSLIKKIRSLKSELAKIPALSLSAHASAEEITRMHDAGFCQHLAKPAEANALVLKIQKMVNLKKI
jgi:CheY-like chemotaxis protein